jgi:hypothetical protein
MMHLQLQHSSMLAIIMPSLEASLWNRNKSRIFMAVAPFGGSGRTFVGQITGVDA